MVLKVSFIIVLGLLIVFIVIGVIFLTKTKSLRDHYNGVTSRGRHVGTLFTYVENLEKRNSELLVFIQELITQNKELKETIDKLSISISTGVPSQVVQSTIITEEHSKSQKDVDDIFISPMQDVDSLQKNFDELGQKTVDSSISSDIGKLRKALGIKDKGD